MVYEKSLKTPKGKSEAVFANVAVLMYEFTNNIVRMKSSKLCVRVVENTYIFVPDRIISGLGP